MTRTTVNPDCLLNVVRGYLTLQDVANRRTGKTTAAIMRALADAHDRPGTPVPVNDPDLLSQTGAVLHIRADGVVRAAQIIIRQLDLTRVEVRVDRDTGIPAITSNFAAVL